MRSTKLTALLIVTVLTASSPTAARADGVALLVGEAETVPDAAEQRAVLWLRDGTWELTIQPLFLRDNGAWTWIVPLPVLPTAIELGDPAFLKDLSVLTTPVTIKACEDYCCCCNETGGGSLDVGAPQSDVQIWQTGTLGDLDYTVLSSTEGTSLVDWLENEGYTLPTTVADALALYDTEDVFFFAAKLTEGIPADAPLDPVVFTLDGIEEPLYPMRLTTAAIGPDPLSLILWVITPKEIAYEPGNIPAKTLKELSGHWGAWWSLEESCTYISNPNPHEELAESEEDWFAQFGTAAVLEAGYEVYRHALFGEGDFGQSWAGEHAIEHTEWSARLGHEDPWSEEILEVADEKYFLTRWNVRWSADGPMEDLLLISVDPAELKQSNVFCDDSGCPDNPCWPCPDGVEPAPSAGDADTGAAIGDTVNSPDAGSSGIPEVVSPDTGAAPWDGSGGVDADLAGDGSGGSCARAPSAFIPWLLVLLASMALLRRVRRSLRRSGS